MESNRFNLIAAYVAAIGIFSKLALVFFEAFFSEAFTKSPIINFFTGNEFQKNIPVVFNIAILFLFLILVLRYYTGESLNISSSDKLWESGNIIPLKKKDNNVNYERINMVVKEFIFYTSIYIIFLLIYYGIEYSFDSFLNDDEIELTLENFNLIKVFIAIKISVKDTANLISTLPLFMCFRILFVNHFKNDDIKNSRLKDERKLFYFLIGVFILVAFIEFSFLCCNDIRFNTFSSTTKNPISFEIVNVTSIMTYFSTLPIIAKYKLIVGLSAGISMGLLMGRIQAMDYIFDFNFPNSRFINKFLDLMVKLLPAYVIVQPFYGFFGFSGQAYIFGTLESLTYFFSGFGKLIYLIFIVYLIDSREFHKFIYLTLAVKDQKNYKVFIERVN